jgi:hypothetical protein
MRRIRIRVGRIEATARLLDTPTADAIWRSFPHRFRGNRWGKELYGGIPVELGLEPEATELVAKGDLGYWPEGLAFCIFFGPTPASRGEEVRAASPVNVFGHLEGDPEVFEAVRGAAIIEVTAL